VLFQRSHVFRSDLKISNKWSKVDDVKIELPKDTVLEVEFVQEFRGEVNLPFFTFMHEIFFWFLQFVRCFCAVTTVRVQNLFETSMSDTDDILVRQPLDRVCG
jgi:hypothetical protein